ncbi:helix-turn-helix domain-containing protein [Stakelama marina]|jgi:excisionase family DNA binding protein|uniref:Helix-turn-helix domain-containing protein n=1 Tax=Stakelama marina TaxID=2826939 RepID=A0A8T4INW5_9SPHN|nr:helix-turn-helix domain-containing protein [Stakelama marina]MBR0554029.1 helix-turn-helix domain-containing protein [Stakelama marina]
MSGHQHIEPICVGINDAARMIGVGRTKLYELISAGELETVKIGNATRVTTASLHALVMRLRVASR